MTTNEALRQAARRVLDAWDFPQRTPEMHRRMRALRAALVGPQAIDTSGQRAEELQELEHEAKAAIKTLGRLGYTWHGAELWKPPLGKAAQQQKRNRMSPQELAEMVLSDCGWSSNNQRLMERVLERIEQYDQANASPQPEQQQAPAKITTDQAHNMGEKGGPASEEERQLFEAWMSGHCFAVSGEWDGTTYVHPTEKSLWHHSATMGTRLMWAAWRDRAALAANGEGGAA